MVIQQANFEHLRICQLSKWRLLSDNVGSHHFHPVYTAWPGAPFMWGSWAVCYYREWSLLRLRSKEKGIHPPPKPFLKSLIPSLKLKTVFQIDKPRGSRPTGGVDYVISSAALWWLILKVGDEWEVGGWGMEGWQRTGASDFVTLL